MKKYSQKNFWEKKNYKTNFINNSEILKTWEKLIKISINKQKNSLEKSWLKKIHQNKIKKKNSSEKNFFEKNYLRKNWIKN